MFFYNQNQIVFKINFFLFHFIFVTCSFKCCQNIWVLSGITRLTISPSIKELCCRVIWSIDWENCINLLNQIDQILPEFFNVSSKVGIVVAVDEEEIRDELDDQFHRVGQLRKLRVACESKNRHSNIFRLA